MHASLTAVNFHKSCLQMSIKLLALSLAKRNTTNNFIEVQFVITKITSQ